MSFVAIAVGGAAVLGAGVAVYEGGKSQGIANSALGIAQAQFGEQQQFTSQLLNLMQNPSQVTSLPGYDFMFGQGQQAVQRGAAAGGFLNSGNEGTALVQFGQGFATSALTQQEQLLASLSGLNASSSNAQNISAAGGAQSSSNAQLNALLSQLGVAAGRFGSNIGASSGGPTITDPSVFGGGGGGGMMPTPASATGSWLGGGN